MKTIQAPPGCTCDATLPPGKRCTSRTLRCSGALAAHNDPPELPTDEEVTAKHLADVLSHFAACVRPINGVLDRYMIGKIARAAEFLDAHAFRLKKERLSSAP